jgi:hypothetical protein
VRRTTGYVPNRHAKRGRPSKKPTAGLPAYRSNLAQATPRICATRPRAATPREDRTNVLIMSNGCSIVVYHARAMPIAAYSKATQRVRHRHPSRINTTAVAVPVTCAFAGPDDLLHRQRQACHPDTARHLRVLAPGTGCWSSRACRCPAQAPAKTGDAGLDDGSTSTMLLADLWPSQWLQ